MADPNITITRKPQGSAGVPESSINIYPPEQWMALRRVSGLAKPELNVKTANYAARAGGVMVSTAVNPNTITLEVSSASAGSANLFRKSVLDFFGHGDKYNIKVDRVGGGLSADYSRTFMGCYVDALEITEQQGGSIITAKIALVCPDGMATAINAVTTDYALPNGLTELSFVNDGDTEGVVTATLMADNGYTVTNPGLIYTYNGVERTIQTNFTLAIGKGVRFIGSLGGANSLYKYTGGAWTYLYNPSAYLSPENWRALNPFRGAGKIKAFATTNGNKLTVSYAMDFLHLGV